MFCSTSEETTFKLIYTDQVVKGSLLLNLWMLMVAITIYFPNTENLQIESDKLSYDNMIS